MGVETRINTINDKKSESLSKMIEVPIFLFGVTYFDILNDYNVEKHVPYEYIQYGFGGLRQ